MAVILSPGTVQMLGQDSLLCLGKKKSKWIVKMDKSGEMTQNSPLAAAPAPPNVILFNQPLCDLFNPTLSDSV